MEIHLRCLVTIVLSQEREWIKKSVNRGIAVKLGKFRRIGRNALLVPSNYQATSIPRDENWNVDRIKENVECTYT